MFKQMFVALVLLSAGAGAQEAPAAYAVAEELNIWNKHINDTAVVFADIAYIRDYPGLKGRVTDSLTAGQPVIIKSDAYNNTFIKDFYAPWHQVEYTAGAQKRTGFIWLGLVALGVNTDKDGKRWMYGYNKYANRSSDEADLALCEIKVMDAARGVIGRTSMLISKNGQTFTEAKILGNMGLAGLQAIYRIGFLGEACGVPTDHYYLGWTGTEFLPLPGKSSVSDAGVFYHEEKLLFPSEHGLDPSWIIKDIADGEAQDSEAENITYTETNKRVKYIWNGKIASEVVEMK